MFETDGHSQGGGVRLIVLRMSDQPEEKKKKKKKSKLSGLFGSSP